MPGTENTVLLAMDFQNGIAGDDAFASTGVLERARDAVAAARRNNIPVVWVRVALREGHPELAATASFAQIAAHGDVDETHASTSIHETLDRHQGEPIVTKRRISAFTGSDLEVLLRGYGASSLVLAGVATSESCLDGASGRRSRLRTHGALRRLRRPRPRGPHRAHREGVPQTGNSPYRG